MAGVAAKIEGDSRALVFALLVSIALHAALLFGLPALQQAVSRRAAAPPPIAARLAEPVEPAPQTEKPAATKTQEKKPAAPRIAKPAPQPAPEPALAPAATPQAAPAAAPAAAAVPPPVAPPAAQPAPIVDMSAATIGQYRLELIGVARRHKRYPAIARENSWTGNVVVTVAVGADGGAQVGVKSGSGHEVLDQQALDMFRQAARAVAVPPVLRGKAFSVEVRAIYGLED